MELDHRPADRLLRLEGGSAIIEGLAGLLIAFLLLTLIVQVAGAAIARNSAEAVVSAAARRASRPGALVETEEARLARDLATALPGVAAVIVDVRLQPEQAVAAARFRWRPPGPAWLPLRIEVRSSAPRMVPP